jgi:catechol 2,3-dioxygenase-like lactoylglutathione lyase family enzyme
MHVRSVHHVGLTTGQFEQMHRFYVGMLGLGEIGRFPEHRIAFLEAGATCIELLGQDEATHHPAGEPTAPGERRGWNHIALEVDDVDAAFAELIERGVEPQSSPEDFPPEAPAFRIAFLRDPDGNLVELIQRISSQEG